MAWSFLLADPFGPFGRLGCLVRRGGLLRMLEWLAVQNLVGLLFSMKLLRFGSPGILPLICRDVWRLLWVFLLLDDLFVVVGVLVVLGLVLDHVVEDAGRRILGTEVVEVGFEPVFVKLLEAMDEGLYEDHGVSQPATILGVSLQEGLDLCLGQRLLRWGNDLFENVNTLSFPFRSHVVNFQTIIIKQRSRELYN